MRKNIFLILKLATMYSLVLAVIVVIIANRYISLFQNAITVFLIIFVGGFLLGLVLGMVGSIGDNIYERSQRKSHQKNESNFHKN